MEETLWCNRYSESPETKKTITIKYIIGTHITVRMQISWDLLEEIHDHSGLVFDRCLHDSGDPDFV